VYTTPHPAAPLFPLSFKTSEFPSFLKNPRFLKSFEKDLNDFGIQLFQTEEKNSKF